MAEVQHWPHDKQAPRHYNAWELVGRDEWADWGPGDRLDRAQFFLTYCAGQEGGIIRATRDYVTRRGADDPGYAELLRIRARNLGWDTASYREFVARQLAGHIIGWPLDTSDLRAEG